MKIRFESLFLLCTMFICIVAEDILCPNAPSDPSDVLTEEIISAWDIYWVIELTRKHPELTNPSFNKNTRVWEQFERESLPDNGDPDFGFDPNDEYSVEDRLGDKVWEENQEFNDIYKIWVCKQGWNSVIFKNTLRIWASQVTQRDIDEISDLLGFMDSKVFIIITLLILLFCMLPFAIIFCLTGWWWWKLNSRNTQKC